MEKKKKLLAELIRREQTILETRCNIWSLSASVSADRPAGREFFEACEQLDKHLRNYRSWVKRHEAELIRADIWEPLINPLQ